MTKTLTEQWRDGKLENGFYYVMSGWRTSIEIRYLGEGFFEGNIKVLAPVPDYDKVKEMSQKVERLEFDNEALEMAHNEGKEINAELLSKNEQLEKQLNLYKRAIERTDRIEKCLNQGGQIKRLEEQLHIAIKALKEINVRSQRDWNEYDCMGCAKKALYDIEMEGVK